MPSTFIWYSSQFKGYKCLTFSGMLIISRHVLSDETTFPFKNQLLAETQPQLHMPVNANFSSPISVLPTKSTNDAPTGSGPLLSPPN